MPTYQVRNANAEETIECADAERAVELFVGMHPEELRNAVQVHELEPHVPQVLIHLNVTVPEYVAAKGNDLAVEFAVKEVEVAVKHGKLHELIAMAELT